MGIILDIVDKVAPEAQELMEKQGLDLKEALKISFDKNGYMKKGRDESE
ncbi:hypothetical protein [Clostridium butyricum]|uniref:Uncharacterized protein n=1 Tax=Clostridium butyricum E4 str. BoNT E BL5262 TaxID=632245 RepID=C4IGU2_CLOBU|nr:hypothetical protein [Clostridium butyricum]EDT74789.1 hypothetical protein CBY_2574 [Clostridium butyricum 5521]EEP52930.1 conserved hypothetical protein [Clostridium butyricum E4 str. BoNT E BL5262]